MSKKLTIIRRAQEFFLVIQTQTGKKEAFGKLYDRYSPDLYRFIYFKVGNKEAAEDLSADVFIKVWEYIQGGKYVDNIRAFFYQTARNCIIDYYRKKQYEPLEEGMENSVIEIKQDIEDAIHYGQNMERIYKGLSRLTEEYKEVIVLRYFHELSHKEIGKIIGKKPGAVRVLLHRAMEALRKQL